VNQLLSVSKLNLNLIEGSPPETVEKIRYSVVLMDQAMSGLGDLSQRLASDVIREERIYYTIEDYIGRLRKSISGEIIFNGEGQTASLSMEMN
jgi:hypothetical protein